MASAAIETVRGATPILLGLVIDTIPDGPWLGYGSLAESEDREKHTHQRRIVYESPGSPLEHF